MRRSRRDVEQTSPQAQEGLLAPQLPHERDETPDLAAGRDRAKVARAAADVAAGRIDTDCYGAMRTIFRRPPRGRSR